MKRKLLKLVPFVSLAVSYPLMAFAQPFGDRCFGLMGLSYTLCKLQQFFNSVLPVLIALGVVYFVWGVVQYFIGNSDEAKTKGKDKIIFGIIGLVVIIGLWGLVYIVVNTFGLNNGSNYAPPLNNLLPSNSNNNNYNSYYR